MAEPGSELAGVLSGPGALLVEHGQANWFSAHRHDRRLEG
jgi:hypothetical protein